MSKKSTIISTIIAIGASMTGTFSSAPVSASVVKDGVTFWSTSEIMDFKAEMLEKIATDCAAADDIPECTRNVYVSYYNEQRDKYMAYMAAEDELANFAITSVNPATETIKIFISDYERDWMTDSLNQVPLTSVYAVWGGPSARDLLMGTVSGSGAFYASEIESNSLRDGIYRLFGASRSGSVNVFNIDEIPTMREVELQVPGSNLASNLSGDFYFTTLRESGGDTYGYRSYGSCLESSDYELGKECRLMFSSEGYYSYLPISVEQETNSREDTNETGQTDETGDSDETDSSTGDDSNKSSESSENFPETDNKTSNPSNSQESSTAGFTLSIKEVSTSTSRAPKASQSTAKSASKTSSSEENQELANTTDTIVANSENDTLELPLSGSITAQTSTKEEHIFPWWIIAFVFSGIILTIWWFIPAKKYKKGVDKK